MDKKYNGLMGMCEMECVVEFLVNKSERLNIPFGHCSISIYEAKKDNNNFLLVGLCHMCLSGHLISKYPNGVFWPSQRLIEVMRNHNECWKDLADIPSFDEWFACRYAFFNNVPIVKEIEKIEAVDTVLNDVVEEKKEETWRDRAPLL